MKVPVYTQGVGQQGIPGVQQTANVTADSFLGTAQESSKTVAAAFRDVSDAAIQLHVQQVKEANQTLVKSRTLRLQQWSQDLLFGENGYLFKQGENAFAPVNGKSPRDHVNEAFDRFRTAQAETLNNPEQQAAFDEHADQLRLSLNAHIQQHEGQQHRVFQRNVLDASDTVEGNNIGLYYNDSAAIQKSLDTLYQNGAALAKLEGLPEQAGLHVAKKNAANALKGAFDSALAQNDHASATRILHDFAPHMDANDMLKMATTLSTEDNKRQALTIGQEVISEIYPRMETSDFERMKNITRRAESGNSRYGKDGQLLTSAKGAQGEMQVMPFTARDPGYGVKPAQNDSPEELARVGNDYLAAMLREYKGDPAKAWAAYNAGPGATQDAIDEAQKTGKDWLSYLPQETQHYVATNMKDYNSDAEQHPRATLADAIKLADSKTTARYGENANPELIDKAREEATYQFKLQEDAIKQRKAEAVANAMKKLEQNNGRYSALSSDDTANLSYNEKDDLRNYGKKVANGDDITSLWLYNKLANHPEELAKLSDDQFYALRTDLSESDFKHFSNQRQKEKGITSANNGPDDLNNQAIKTELDNRLRMLGTDPSPSDTLQKNLATRVGGIRQFVNNYFRVVQMQTGKHLSEAEIAQHMDALFAKNYEFKGLMSDSSGVLLNMKTSDLPNNIKTGIQNGLKRQGISDPNEAQILNAYWTLQMAKK